MKWKAVLLGLAVVAGASSCGAGDTKPSKFFFVTTMKSSSGQAEILLTPRVPVRGLVLYMHGYLGTEKDLLHFPPVFPLRDVLLANGFAVAASRAHGNNMGKPASVHDQALLLHDAEEHLPAVSTVDVVGFSMGGLDALLVASRHVLPGLGAVVVLSGMTDQTSFVHSPLWAAVRAAYGKKKGQALINALTPSDPARQDPHSYAGYRYWFWQSPTDETVPQGQATSMVARLQSAGVPVQLSPLDGKHGNLTLLQPNRIVQYFES